MSEAAGLLATLSALDGALRLAEDTAAAALRKDRARLLARLCELNPDAPGCACAVKDIAPPPGTTGPTVEAHGALECDDAKMGVKVCWAVCDSRDGAGDITTLAGLDLRRHQGNALAYYDHGKSPEWSLPIGTCIDPETGEYKVWNEGPRCYAWIFFFKGEGAHAKRCRDLYELVKAGVVRGGSYGYRALSAEQLPYNHADPARNGSNLRLTHAEVLEISLVGVPAHPEAVKALPPPDFAQEGPGAARPPDLRDDVKAVRAYWRKGARNSRTGQAAGPEAQGPAAWTRPPDLRDDAKAVRAYWRKALRARYKDITRTTDRRGREICYEGNAYHRVPCHQGDQGEARTHPGKGPAGEARQGRGGKKGGRLARIRDQGRRRRVLAGYRAEAELASAVEGLQWPDSEAQDVTLLIDPGGELITDLERVQDHLRIRADVVKRLREGGLAPDYERRARDWLAAHRLYLFEVKALLTQVGAGQIRMSAKAAARKERTEGRYAAPFWTVAVDNRRGGKFSGHRLYLRRGVGSARLAEMDKVADFNDLLTHLQREETTR
jgi:hypothetical protein